MSCHPERLFVHFEDGFFLGQFVSPLLVSMARTSSGTMQGAFVIAGALGIVIAVVTWFIVTPRQAEPALA